ncbi:hypothetical protein YC2023_027778 [Brassica napus]
MNEYFPSNGHTDEACYFNDTTYEYVHYYRLPIQAMVIVCMKRKNFFLLIILTVVSGMYCRMKDFKRNMHVGKD